MLKIGIMQGRLSPPEADRIQSFPVKSWREEFGLARQAQLSSIEWIYQVETEHFNPLATDDGVDNILEMVRQSGVEVRSVSADYYMMRRLIDTGGRPDAEVLRHLSALFERAGKLGVSYVMIPFVDGGRLKTSQDRAGAIEAIRTVFPTIESTGVELHMETDLPPKLWAELLEEVDYPTVRVCYDTGDRASCGFDVEGDMDMLSPWLGSVHIKDREHNGGSVPLGKGDADLPACIRLFQACSYAESFILQTARETEISELDLAIRNRQFVNDLMGT